MRHIQASSPNRDGWAHIETGSRCRYGPVYPQSDTHCPVVSPTDLTFGNPLLQFQAPYHRHRLPNHSLDWRTDWNDHYNNPITVDGYDLPSVVGEPGMPEPAVMPRCPKLRFLSKDDVLLVELKETKNLTWKQIADFFPGRSSGTLQVRYCTKLKAKMGIWTEDMVSHYSRFEH
jgi:hypothetical protein